MSADNPITLLGDGITILSHVARSSSEYVSMVTKVLRGDGGKLDSNEIFALFGRQGFVNNLIVVHLKGGET